MVSINVIPNSTTDINESYFENMFFIYPNPVTKNLTIEAPQKSEIKILNIEGQLIKTIANSGIKTNVDISTMPYGVYVVEVRTEKGVGVKKFIKE